MMKSRRYRGGKIGCGGWLLLIVLGIGFLAWLGAKNRPPGASPAPARESLQVGDQVVVEVPGNTRVFLATTDDSWNPMIDAQNAKSHELTARLIERGDVIAPPNGVRGVIVKIAVTSKFVRISAGPFSGREGWVQHEFVRRAPALPAAKADPASVPDPQPAGARRIGKRR
jgi:hypothetical protein